MINSMRVMENIKTYLESNTFFSQFDILMTNEFYDNNDLGYGKFIIVSVSSISVVDTRKRNDRQIRSYNINIVPFFSNGLTVVDGTDEYYSIEGIYLIADKLLEAFNNKYFDNSKIERIEIAEVPKIGDNDDVFSLSANVVYTELKPFT